MFRLYVCDDSLSPNALSNVNGTVMDTVMSNKYQVVSKKLPFDLSCESDRDVTKPLPVRPCDLRPVINE